MGDTYFRKRPIYSGASEHESLAHDLYAQEPESKPKGISQHKSTLPLYASCRESYDWVLSRVIMKSQA